ncbi:GNAT family N-acetyltransferase [Pseudoponticoccus marisrubri]|uniref:N-acetyltransferase domain-containing protein n=1 Tax=Pseudoponticoccus marisrubri TaxID=1685382 RepID=A0A0W7WFS8_9RHOB|nr:GNAT family N-acetyltransferase [Pseudoponticoccus marisrubri]KUF09515.1 hypothetical protein AVJ23_16645 [Pseudoponticoccus marisrubri]
MSTSNLEEHETGPPRPAGQNRSNGTLTRAELAQARQAGLSLAYDAAQDGWVRLDVIDDIDPPESAGAADITLRPWRAEDVFTYVALLDDNAVWETLPEDYPAPLTGDMARALIELSNDSPHHLVRAIVMDGAPVGQVRLQYDADPGDSATAEISYWLGRAYWGRGIASATVARFAESSLARHPGITRLIARVKSGNIASARVLEKAGFRLQGTDPKDADWQVYHRSR